MSPEVSKNHPSTPSLLGDQLAAMADFLALDAAPGIFLVVATALALIWANSPLAHSYHHILEARFGLGSLKLETIEWINDALMAVFFLQVGLEIKREVVAGELSERRKLMLPAVAALGGMLVPVCIYLAFNRGHAAAMRGWAIPAATDIAFALGLLALLGPRVPASLKVFLAALAILDDLGAILIIALAYGEELWPAAFVLAAAGLVILIVLNRRGVAKLWPYLLVGTFVWACVLKSGIHATLAGVLIAQTIPLTVASGRDWQVSPLRRLEHALHPWVGFLIVPLFALANAGVSFSGIGLGDLFSSVPLGIAAGLLFGKQLGVMGFSWLAIRLGIAHPPAGATRRQFHAVAVLCGIGFTMSLFIGSLAFEHDLLLREMKIGVLLGSLLAAVSGYLLARLAARTGESA
ncbi:MAG: Na+/H+ antiporter NhaA [Candidatus Binataceae bacterium]